MRINLYKHIYPIFFKYFRAKRMKLFEERFDLQPETWILDVGGTEYNWTFVSKKPKIVFLNLSVPVGSVNTDSSVWLIADGRHLPFNNNVFAVVYSNSVIEHLSNYQDQSIFANECRRVGKRYYIQTPNKWFPIEPHYITLFIHWLPASIQKNLIRNCSIRGWLTRPSQEDCDQMVEEIRLLPFEDVHQMFPEAEIWRERFAGITKSHIAINNPKI